MAKLKRNHDETIESFSDPMETLFKPTQTTQDNSGETAHLKEVVKQAYSKRDIELKTDLNNSQILVLVRMELFADMFKSKVMKSVARNFKQHRVSFKRQGRKEFVDIAKSMTPNMEPSSPTIKDRLLGG